MATEDSAAATPGAGGPGGCLGLQLREVDAYHITKFGEEGYLASQALLHFRGW